MVIVGSICIPSLLHPFLSFSNDYMPVFTNSAVQTNAVAGEIDTVVINAAGSGYNNGTYDNVAINGDGTGGRVSIVVDGGKIISATVTSGGTGYTFGKISVDSITGIGTGTGGQVDVIIPPPNGHGADAVVELGAFRVMINAKLSYDEGAGDFPVDNDYRRIGLITNPLKFGTEELISDLTVSATKAVIFSPTFQGNYVPDEIITQTRVVGGQNVTARGRVISWNATTKLLKYYQNAVDGIFPEVTGTQMNLMVLMSSMVQLLVLLVNQMSTSPPSRTLLLEQSTIPNMTWV